MALTPQLQASQASVFALTSGQTSALLVSQTYTMAVANFPTPELKAGMVTTSVVTGGETRELKVSQSWVTVICCGRTDNPKVRVWTYTLDGNDFYIVRLGTESTLVYHFQSEQWYVWGSHDTELWRAYCGTNWQGGNLLANQQSNDRSSVICGDDGNGALYFLDPDNYIDDDAVEGESVPRNFKRVATGQVAHRSYESEPCYGVQLVGSIGKMDEATLTAVTLYTSDDRGVTYTDRGTVTVPNDDLDLRVQWLSLGQFSVPGRLFKIEDEGAIQRLDYLFMLGADE